MVSMMINIDITTNGIVFGFPDDEYTVALDQLDDITARMIGDRVTEAWRRKRERETKRDYECSKELLMFKTDMQRMM